MTKQVSIRDDDYTLAHDLADKLGTTVDGAVSTALREFRGRTSEKQPLSAAQQADLDAIRALVEEAQKHVVPGAVNDHGFLYDWNGLPT